MIPPRRHQNTEEGGTDSWLMSYADMITLLMCFFIIFVSVSEPKRDKFSSITKGMADQFGAVDLSTPFHGMLREMQGVVERHQALKDIAIEGSDRGVAMEISAPSLFIPGSVELKPEAATILGELADSVKKAEFVRYRIWVEGHTDNSTTEIAVYPSNWEFSAARAARIVRFLLESGVKPERISAAGMADSQPKVPNLDAGGKPIPANQERNQRLVIRMERVD
jgi:chemotaxis protein MotB